MPRRRRGDPDRRTLEIALEPETEVLVSRVCYIPRPNPSDDDRAAMLRCLFYYSIAVRNAGHQPGRVFASDGVLFIAPDELLHGYAERLAQWGTFGQTVKITVPESYT